MYKYRAIASFFEWQAVCRLALDATERLLREAGALAAYPDAFWQDFRSYEMLRHAHGRSLQEILEPSSATMQYDVARWIGDGMPADVTAYRLRQGEGEVIFELGEDGERELRAALKVWTTSLRGLTKGVTRIRSSAQLRMPRRRAAGGRVPGPLLGGTQALPLA